MTDRTHATRFQSSARSGRIRVAIIGGGCAGMTTAFELTSPQQQGRYEVTVYQMGFRLGGKGASGRGVAGRIEEHGLHLWMGFYENAFQLMRQCYDELGRDPAQCPLATWQDAFSPAPHVAVTDQLPNGEWDVWLSRFPAGRGLPGDGLSADNPFTIASYMAKAAALVVELLRSAQSKYTPARGDHPDARRTAEPSWLRESERPRAAVEGLLDAVDWLLRHGQLATVAALVEAAELLRGVLTAWPVWPRAMRAENGVLLRLIDAIADAARRQLASLVARDDALRRIWRVIDLILAILRGALKHGLAIDPRGFDAIDDYDWREWLTLHGASQESVDSGFVRGIYDLTFAYLKGDPARPSLSAAAALRGAMRMFFTYRGSLFWRMGAGMGDVVFAPLYEVLKRRGVRFEFFHRLTDIEVSERDRPDPHVTALHFDVQARVRDGAEYRPLVEVHGVPSWPAEADCSQLVGGDALAAAPPHFESPWDPHVEERRVLEVQRDFDFAVLAVGGGAVDGACSQLIARSARWKRALDNLHSVATQAAQIWLTEDMHSLGWEHPPVNLSGWVEPFDTWADMSHLISAEAYSVPVKTIAYFCSPLPDPPPGERASGDEFHDQQQLRVRNNTLKFLQQEIGALWPAACDAAGAFRFELLAAEPTQNAARAGEKRFDSQFWTANVRPSDRYVLALPGTRKYRLSPLDMSFDNFTVAGDWTETGLNTGCVESAVMSGRLAAHALSGMPSLEEIIGYDHP